MDIDRDIRNKDIVERISHAFNHQQNQIDGLVYSINQFCKRLDLVNQILEKENDYVELKNMERLIVLPGEDESN